MVKEKFYRDLTTEKKKELRNHLSRVTKNRKEQIALIESLKKPYKDNLDLIKEILQNRKPISHLIEHSLTVNKYTKDFSGSN